MTLEAYYYDNIDNKNPKLQHRGKLVDEQTLIDIGILHWNIKAEGHENNELYNKIVKERGYGSHDLITISREKCGDEKFDALNVKFFKEHLHIDEEIRFIQDGSGYFDVRNKDDIWIRIHVKKDDLVVLPEGIYHRFICDEKEFIHVKRLFKETVCWTPFVRADKDTDKKDQRIKYLESRNKGLFKTPDYKVDEKDNSEIIIKESSNGSKGFIINTRAKGYASYPHMRQIGKQLFVSGISSRRPDNTHIGADKVDGKWVLDMKKQTEGILENLKKLLLHAKYDLSNVVDITCFINAKDDRDFQQDYKSFNSVYNTYFNAFDGPTRTTIGVKELPHPNLLLEVKAICYKE